MVGFNVKCPAFRLFYSVLLAKQVCGVPTLIYVLIMFVSEDSEMPFGGNCDVDFNVKCSAFSLVL